MTIAEENEKLKVDLVAGDQLQTESAKQVEDLNAKVVALTDANTNAEAKAAVLTEQHDEAIKAEKAKVDEISSAKALEIVAQQGAEPADEDPGNGQRVKTLDELWKDYHAIENLKERTVFYRTEIKPQL